jgi:hypothetical protein
MVTIKRVTTGMMCASLIINIAVLCAICPVIMAGTASAEFAYGARTVARDILLSMYFSILVCSFILLVIRDERMVAALLCVQIVYKLAAPFAAWTVSNPVIISNIGIALFHCVTVGFIAWNQKKTATASTDDDAAAAEPTQAQAQTTRKTETNGASIAKQQAGQV